MTEKPIKVFCPECGPSDACDEDGCCLQCGATATGPKLDELLAYRDQVLAENRVLREDNEKLRIINRGVESANVDLLSDLNDAQHELSDRDQVLSENEQLRKDLELSDRDQVLSENEQLRKDLAYQKHLAERKADRDKIAIDNENLREVIRTLTDRLDSACKHANALNMDNTGLRNKLDLEIWRFRQHMETIKVLDRSLENPRPSRRDLYVLAVTIGALAGNSDAKIKDYPIDADTLMAAVDGGVNK